MNFFSQNFHNICFCREKTRVKINSIWKKNALCWLVVPKNHTKPKRKTLIKWYSHAINRRFCNKHSSLFYFEQVNFYLAITQHQYFSYDCNVFLELLLCNFWRKISSAQIIDFTFDLTAQKTALCALIFLLRYLFIFDFEGSAGNQHSKQDDLYWSHVRTSWSCIQLLCSTRLFLS